MKRYLVPTAFAAFIVMSLVVVVPAQGQYGGKKGGSQQGCGMCSKSHGGASSQTPFSQSNSTMRNFSQATGTQYPYSQNSNMQYPYSQNTAMQFPYSQNTFAQNPYTQSSTSQYPYTQANTTYPATQFGIQTASFTTPLDAAKMEYLLQMMQNQASTTPTDSGVRSGSDTMSNAQRIQQRRTAAQSTNVQLLGSSSR